MTIPLSRKSLTTKKPPPFLWLSVLVEGLNQHGGRVVVIGKVFHCRIYGGERRRWEGVEESSDPVLDRPVQEMVRILMYLTWRRPLLQNQHSPTGGEQRDTSYISSTPYNF